MAGNVQTKRSVEVKGYYCPTCDKSFNENQLVAGMIVRHKIPRQHPDEHDWDRNERLYPGFNVCDFVGLPIVRTIGSFEIAIG